MRTEKNAGADMAPETGKSKIQMPFNKVNFIMMGCCVALIVIGFLLISGGGSASDAEFNPDIFSTRRLVVGPTLTFLGFLLMAFAIIWTPRGAKAKKAGEVAGIEEMESETEQSPKN